MKTDRIPFKQNISIAPKKKAMPWGDQEAIVPKGLKIQECPGFTHYTQFDPQPGEVGLGMREEFKRLTGG